MKQEPGKRIVSKGQYAVDMAAQNLKRAVEPLIKPATRGQQQRYIVVVKELDVRGDNTQPYWEMLENTQNFTFCQINNLLTWAVYVPFMEHQQLRIPASCQEMAETLARTCEAMGGICTVQPVIEEEYDLLYEHIGGVKNL